MDDSFDEEYELVPKMPNQRTFCLVLSYAFHYHTAVARFQQIGREALKYLDKGATETLDELCTRDPDIVEMFKLINTMRGLGL